MSRAGNESPEVYVTVEFQVLEDEYDKVQKLIAYAKRLGITSYATDSFDSYREPFRG